MVSEETQQGAWDFMKYLTKPDVQAKWHTATGYFSINPDAYNEPLVKEQYEKYPQLKSNSRSIASDEAISSNTRGFN